MLKRCGVLMTAVLALMMAGPFACSSGGSSGGNQNSDTTPPTVSSTIPPDAAFGVSVTTPIVARFSESMNEATINASTFVVTGVSGTIAGTVVCSGVTATFLPSSSLASLSTYTVTISTGVRDLAGNTLQTARFWSFTTGIVRAWSAPVVLDNLIANAGAPVVAADRLNNGNGDGTVVVAWVQNDGDQDSIFASRFDGTWSTPVTVETVSTGGSAGGASSPRVAMNQSGQAAMVWNYDDGTDVRVWSNRFNGTWDTAASISGTPVVLKSPQVAFDASGDAFFTVWSQNQLGSSQYNDHAAERQYASPGGWNSVNTIDLPDLGDASEIQIAAWGSKNAVAVWTEYVTGTGSRTYANSASSGTWSTAVQIDPLAPNDSAAPMVAVDPNGNAIAVWMEWAASRTTLMASRYSLGSWSTPTAIDDVNGGDAGNYDPPRQQVVMDGSGNAIIVWQQANADYSEYSIYARRCPAGPLSGCEALVTIETGTSYADFPQIAFAPNGDAITVWKQENGTAVSIFANCYASATNSWNGNTTLLGGSNSDWSEGPRIAIDGSGRATVVWTENEAGEYNIRAVRYE